MPDITKNRIKELREKQKLTQKELATLLGIDESTVAKHENMQRALSEDSISAYSQIFKIKTYELFLSFN